MEKLLSLVVYVPSTHLEPLKKALFAAGAGRLGNYEQCSWEVLGRGQFKPLQDSRPAIGLIGEVTTVEEYRLEVLLTENVLKAVVSALRQSHPYEEPAFTVTANLAQDG